MIKNVIRPALLSMALGLTTSFVSRAAMEFDNFNSSGYDAYIMYQDWTVNDQPADPLTTTSPFAGTYWETFGFYRPSSSDYPGTGYKEIPVTGKITSKSSVDNNYKRVAIHLSYQDTDWKSYPHTVWMQIAENSDFEYPVECEGVVVPSAVGEYYIFDLPERQTSDYYRFLFDVPTGGPANGWLQVYEIFFYLSTESVTVEYNQDTNSCTFTALKGDLHMRATEYDASGNVVGSPIGTVARAENDLWENKVAEPGEPFEVQAPTTPGNYLDITAKSVIRGSHMPETHVTLTSSGISSIVPNIEIDNSSDVEKEEWFDITGTRLEQPASGFMICKKGNKVTKYIIP